MCEYCENGNGIPAEYSGEGIMTVKNAIDAMFGRVVNPKVAWIDGKALWVDNSSGEYAELGFDISYCPFCGKKLDEE